MTKLFLILFAMFSSSAINLNLVNNTDQVQTSNLFDVQEVVNNTETVPDTGQTFNTATPVSSGDQLPGNRVTSIVSSNNKVYVTMDSGGGLWIYDEITGIGKAYNTTTPVTSGDKLPSNICYSSFIINNTLIIGTNFGLWVYDIVSDIGKVYNTTTPVASGDMLPNNLVMDIYYIDNKIYVATNTSGVWIYDEITGTGKVYNTTTPVFSGDQLPNNITKSIYYDNNTLYVGTTNNGLWIYDEITGIGKAYNTTTPVTSGDKLPSNGIRGISKSNNLLYIGTVVGGLWVYDVVSDIGKVYNTTTPVASGDMLPFNNISNIYELNNILYVATGGPGGGLWVYNPVSDTGKIYNTSTAVISGDQLQSNNLTNVYKSGNNIYLAINNGGIWIYTETYSVDITSNGDIPYNEIVLNYFNSPVQFNKLKVISGSTLNIGDLAGAFQYITRSASGKIDKHQIDVISYKIETTNASVINVSLEDFIIDKDHYFEITLQPFQELQLMFNQEKQVNNMRLLPVRDGDVFQNRYRDTAPYNNLNNHISTVFENKNGQKKNTDTQQQTYSDLYSRALDNFNAFIEVKENNDLIRNIAIAGVAIILIRKIKNNG